jgi:hypothetical protein
MNWLYWQHGLATVAQFTRLICADKLTFFCAKATRQPLKFQKYFDHPGIIANCILAALARLDLARAYAVQDDRSKARAAYQDFFTLWKDADPDIPMLKQGKAEYAKLQ